MRNFQKKLNKILELANHDAQIDALWLYGSQAKNTASQHSDIDLAVLFSEFEADLLERRLRPEVLAIEWCELLGLAEGKLSIVDMAIAPIPLTMGVLSSGKLLVNKNPAHELLETQRIMSRWEIDYQYHYKVYGEMNG